VKTVFYFDKKCDIIYIINHRRANMQKLKQIWNKFADKHPKISNWVREGGLFFLVSNLITITRGLMISLLKPLFNFMGTGAVGFPDLTLKLFGVEFSWYIIGASEKQGGAAYFTAFIISLWICEIINFFLQRKFVFCSSGKIGRQAALYFTTFVFITCVVNAISNIWIGVAEPFVMPIVYNLGTTFITGGVAMVVFFFANRFIFKDSNKNSSDS
jgi:putative flippase GtrA